MESQIQNEAVRLLNKIIKLKKSFDLVYKLTVADVVGATSFNIVNNAWFNTAGADWLLNVWTALGLASHVLVTDTGALLTAVCGRLPCGVDVVEDSSFVNATNCCWNT